MKNAITLAAVFTAGLLVAATTTDRPQTGQYQLVTGSYNAYMPGASRATPLGGMFRINTATGGIEEIFGTEKEGHIIMSARPLLP